MNIGSVKEFLLSKTGRIILLGFAILTVFYFIGNSRSRAAASAEKEAQRAGAVNRKVVGRVAPEKEELAVGEIAHTETISEDIQRFRPVRSRDEPVNAEPKKILEESRVSSLPALIQKVSPPSKAPLNVVAPRNFAPRGMLIKVSLVITIDSGNFQTPVLGVVTEDVFWNKKLIIPAGTLVHAKASAGRERDRIQVTGDWTFVWQDGREYEIKGTALHHEFDEQAGFSITDGSAGIKGTIEKSDKYQELKMMGASFLAGMARGTKETTNTIFGNQQVSSVSNAATEGVSDAGEMYAKYLLERIQEEGYFVRVAAGTQFYLYTLDVFEPDLASVAGVIQGRRSATSFDLAAEKYREQQQLAERETKAAAGIGDNVKDKEIDLQNGFTERDRYLKQIRDIMASQGMELPDSKKETEKESSE